ncbi:unnamed protein product [Brassicogethes aeneus]|uniref:Uncharacterized protein n=1 Tax=Brassicogethes aeneus TaxID=1431903 RepID=A0A9P0B578_BRAAE|nr:unnamed protein product [Brassicogethes aeneus]
MDISSLRNVVYNKIGSHICNVIKENTKDNDLLLFNKSMILSKNNISILQLGSNEDYGTYFTAASNSPLLSAVSQGSRRLPRANQPGCLVGTTGIPRRQSLGEKERGTTAKLPTHPLQEESLRGAKGNVVDLTYDEEANTTAKCFRDMFRAMNRSVSLTELGSASPFRERIPVGNGGGSAGPTRSSTSDCTASGANQPGSLVMDTGKPTGSRRSSVDSVEYVWDEEAQKSILKSEVSNVFKAIARSYSFTGAKKRKVQDTSLRDREEEIYKRRESSEAFVLKEALEEITRLSKILEANIEQNTKTENKKLAVGMTKHVEVINRQTIRNWIEKHSFEEGPKMLYNGETQTEENGTYAITTQTVEQGTQTEAEAPNETTEQPDRRQLVVQCVPLKHKMPEGTARVTFTTAEAFARDYPGGEIQDRRSVKKRVISSVGEKSVQETITTTWLLIQESGGESLICRQTRQACLVEMAEKTFMEPFIFKGQRQRLASFQYDD